MSKWNEKIFGEVATTSKGRLTLQSEAKELDYLPLINTDAVNGNPSLYAYSKGAVLCEQDDVLMLWDGERSGLVAIGYSGVVGSTFAKLSPNDFIDSKYLFYFLDSKFHWIQGQRTGTGVPHVPKNLDKILWVKYPENKTEQQHIARILSTADAVIEKTQAAIAKYKAIKQGMLQDLFTRGIDVHTGKLRPRYEDAPELYKESKVGWIPREWEEDVLGNLVSSYSGGTPSRSNEGYYKGDIPWVTSSEVNQDAIFKTKQHITQEALDNSSAKWVDANTVLVAMYGATAGQISMLRIKATTNQAVLACSTLTEISSDYLYYLLIFNRERLLNKTQGTGQPNLSKSIIDALEVIVPKPNEQQKIAERLKAIDNKLQTEQSYLQKMQSLKKGLMEDLLSGRKGLNLSLTRFNE